MEERVRLKSDNPLGYEKIGRLLTKFAVPSIIAGMVGALYNIVDQIFIGQGVGMLGNAATNVAFPLTTVCTAMALLIGMGSASNFNLFLGEGKNQEAGKIAANGIFFLAASGIAVGVIVLAFTSPLIHAFGATEKVYPYALSYTKITALGMPFLIFANGCSILIRADGSPTYSMFVMLAGAVINTILDPLFIFAFAMGIEGAAWATVLGQVISAVLAFMYLSRFKTVRLTKQMFRPKAKLAKRIASLGAASFFNQIAMMAVQIVMNNTLTYYGSHSNYGADIPLAAVGVVSKVNILLISIVVGIAQGNQPIVGFNYGARNFSRVRKAWKIAAGAASVFAVAAFICFQLFPTQIIGIFGNGSSEYYEFASRYIRVYMFMVFLIGLQPVTSNFFTSIGKAKIGIFLSLTRQIIVLLPLIVIFPMIWGINGVIYAGPIADTVAAVLAVALVAREFRIMRRMEAEDMEGRKQAKAVFGNS